MPKRRVKGLKSVPSTPRISPLTEAILPLLQHAYEEEGRSTRDLMRSFGIARSTIAWTAKKRKWVRKRVAIYGPRSRPVKPVGQPETETAGPVENQPESSPDKDAVSGTFDTKWPMEAKAPSPEASVPRKRAAHKTRNAKSARSRKARRKQAKSSAGSKRRTAEILTFPGVTLATLSAAKDAANEAAEVKLLPRFTPEEARKAKGTLSELRKLIPIDSLMRLDALEGTLSRFGHWLNIYLDPLSYLDLGKMTETEAMERAVATQTLALKLILPTERDTLAGAITALTAATHRTIEMQRRVAGIVDARVRRAGLGGAAMDPDDAAEAEQERQRVAALEADVDFATLPIEQLRIVTNAMELLQQRQHNMREPPRPPPPDPLDDLYLPAPAEAPVDSTPPEVTR